MPTVDIEGIGPIDFPEGVTREQAADIIRRAQAAKTPRQSLSIPQQAGAVMAGIGRGFWGTPVAMLEGLGGITGSQTLLDLARGARESGIGKTLLEVPENYRDRTASTAGEVIGNLGSMVVPGSRLGSASISGLQGASEQVQRADENRRAGMNVSSGDQQIAAGLGSLTGLLDMIPYARMAGTIAPKGLKLAEKAAGSSVIGRALGTSAIEGATEAGQQGLQNVIERGYNANQDLTEGLLDNAVAGGAAGFGMDAILGMMAKGTGKRVMQRRAALDSVPLDALPDANSVGIRNVGGNPLVEYIARMEAAASKPMPDMPREDYRKPVVEAEAPVLTAKEKKAAEALRIQQRMQQTMPEIGAIDVNAIPAENYGQKEKASPFVTPDVSLDAIAAEQQAAIDAQAAIPQEPVTPLYSKDAAYPDVRLTEEGTIEEPSRLAMDQPGAPRFSVDTQLAAPTQYTVDNLRQEIEAGTKPQIALDIYNEMEALGGEGLFSTRLVDSLNSGKSEGTYANRVIQLALESKSKEDLLRTLNHEAVHGMKQMGLFNDTEWSILNAAFNPNTSLTDFEREQYAKLYSGDQAKVNEEAIARGIERYAAGQIDAPKEAVSVAAKAAGTVERLGNVLRGKGFQNATDVMQSFRSGEMATRDANLPTISKPRTMQDYEKGLYDTPIPNGKTNRPVVQPAKNVGPVKDGKRTTSLADLIDQNEAPQEGQDQRQSVVPQLPVSGKTPFGSPDERTQLKKAIDTFVVTDPLGGMGLKVRQNMLDMRAGIAALGRKAGDTSARTGSEAAVRNYDVAQDFASSALKNGALEYVGSQGDGYFRANGDVANAPATVFKEAYEKGKLSQLFHYLAAERADVLRSEGREKKISAADAAAWKEYGKDPEIADYAKRWKTFNDQMVDTLQKSGRIDAETAKKFKANTYLPFYRIEEGADGSVNFQSSGATLASSPRLEKLKGSELDIGDPTDNIVRNVNTLTSMAMKNEAMQRVVRDGIQLKFIKQVPKSESGKMNVKVWVDGKEKHFEVSDPILYESLTASRIPASTALTLAGLPARVLREGVTLDPVFMINNPVRDSTMAWLQGYTDFPLQQLAQSAYKAIANKPSFQRLEKAGVIGNSIRGEGGAAGTGKTLRESYKGKTGFLHQLEEFSRKSEGITRNTVYEAVMKRTGGDEAQAQYEARELLNFNRRGADRTVQLVNALIPFQNAAWQGADVLYRGLRGHGANPEMRKKLLTRMGIMAGLSTAYTIMASQTPEWQEASEEERDANWFVGGLKIKIPFEAGFIAKVIPERVTALYMGHDTGREFLGAMSRFLWSTMKADMVPQAMKPAWEVKTNHSSFRDKPIEPEYMRSKEKTQRFDDNTSELAKKISEYTEVLSPLQIDHLLRGYTGAIGTYGIQALSLAANPEKAKAAMSMAERTPSDLPVLGRFFQREEGGKSLGQYYELSDRAEQAQSALKAGLEPTDERVKLAAIDRAIKPIDRQMKTLTDAEKKVRSLMATGAMSPEEARPMLREYRKMKTELAKTAVQMERE